MEEPSLPSQLATRFKDARHIGTGGMGHVFLCFDDKRQKQLALKLLRAGISRSARFKRRFSREGRLLASLEHANIVRCYDFVDDGTYVYLTMEYISGPTLEQKLKDGALEQRESLEIVAQLADALQEIHGLDILHRDIKPANIVLEDGRAILMDFGLAKTETTVDQATLTGSREFVGTPLYLPPEQMLRGESDLRSDIFQLGLVLFEALVGHLPFAGRTMSDLIEHYSTNADRKVRPSEHGIAVDKNVDELVADCLSYDPQKRPATAAELAQRCRRLTKDHQLPKELLARFGDLRVIGRGGMGVVYRAIDNNNGQEVALKVIIPEISVEHVDFAAHFARMKRELKLLQQVGGKTIIKLRDEGVVENVPYLVLDYVEGQELDVYVKENELTPYETMEMLLPLTEALVKIHKAGILHRDLKPQNVLIDRSEKAVLLDFGLATRFSGEMLTELTSTGQLVGTVPYMPPEYLAGAAYTRKGDVYQLAATLYFALTGQYHLPSHDMRAILEYAVKGNVNGIQKPSYINSDIDCDLDEIIMKALNRDPLKRTQSATTLSKEIKSWLKKQKTSPPVALETRAPNLQQNKSFAPYLILTLLTFVFSIWWMSSKDIPKKVSLEQFRTIDVKVMATPTQLLFRWSERPSRRYRYALSCKGELVKNGSEDSAKRHHEILFTNLLANSEYELTLWSGKHKFSERASTKTLSFGPYWHVSSLGNNLYAAARSNSEALEIILENGEYLEKETLPKSGQGVLIKLPPNGQKKVQWRLVHSGKTLKRGSVKPLKAIHLLEAHLPALRPIWFNELLTLHHNNGTSCYASEASLIHKWSYTPKNRLSLSGLGAFCAPAILNKKEVLITSLSKENRLFTCTLSPSAELKSVQREKYDFAALPLWQGHQHKGKVYYLASPDSSISMSLLTIDLKTKKGKKLPLISSTKLLVAAKGQTKPEKLGNLVTSTFICGQHFVTIVRHIQRLANGTIPWQVITLPLDGKGNPLCYCFTSRALALGPVEVKNSSFELICNGKLVHFLEKDKRMVVDEKNITSSFKEFSPQVVTIKAVKYFVAHKKRKNDHQSFLSSDTSPWFDSYLCSFTAATSKFRSYSPPLLKRGERSTDSGVTFLTARKKQLIGATARHLFAVDLMVRAIGHWQLPVEVGRTMSLSLGENSRWAVITDKNKLLCVPSSLVAANETKALSLGK